MTMMQGWCKSSPAVASSAGSDLGVWTGSCQSRPHHLPVSLCPLQHSAGTVYVYLCIMCDNGVSMHIYIICVCVCVCVRVCVRERERERERVAVIH